MGVEIKIEGLEQLNSILKQLPDEVNKKVIVSGLKKAARPLVDSARQEVPRHSGQGAESIGARFVRGSGTLPVIDVGPKVRGKNSGWYLRFVHWGTEDHTVRKRGYKARANAERRGEKGVISRMRLVDTYVIRWATKVKGVRANPFMQRAFDKTKDKIIAAMGDEVAASVEGFFRKNGYKK